MEMHHSRNPLQADDFDLEDESPPENPDNYLDDGEDYFSDREKEILSNGTKLEIMHLLSGKSKKFTAKYLKDELLQSQPQERDLYPDLVFTEALNMLLNPNMPLNSPSMIKWLKWLMAGGDTPRDFYKKGIKNKKRETKKTKPTTGDADDLGSPAASCLTKGKAGKYGKVKKSRSTNSEVDDGTHPSISGFKSPKRGRLSRSKSNKRKEDTPVTLDSIRPSLITTGINVTDENILVNTPSPRSKVWGWHEEYPLMLDMLVDDTSIVSVTNDNTAPNGEGCDRSVSNYNLPDFFNIDSIDDITVLLPYYNGVKYTSIPCQPELSDDGEISDESFSVLNI